MSNQRHMNKENLKIEFKTVPISPNIIHRYCYWRIVPSELNLFQRLFNNPWRKVWFIDRGTKEEWFSPNNFVAVRSKYKTVGDMVAREERLEEALRKPWDEALKESPNECNKEN